MKFNNHYEIKYIFIEKDKYDQFISQTKHIFTKLYYGEYDVTVCMKICFDEAP